MKHSFTITLILISFFLVSQLFGILIIREYIDIKRSAQEHKTVIKAENYIIEPPRVKDESKSYIYIALSIAVGTALLLLIIRFKKVMFWKSWYLLSVAISIMVALYPFILRLSRSGAFWWTTLFSFLLAYLKVSRRSMVIHNTTELLIYAGIAGLIVPILNLYSAIMLLILISLYDMYAVWHSKHMVAMARFQTSHKLFSGFMLSYSAGGRGENKISYEKSAPAKNKDAKDNEEETTAILGGGDIAFPLIFSGVLMKTTGSLTPAFISTLFAATGLSILLILSKKKRFYPAMPFITAGCFLSLAVIRFLL